VLEERGTPVFTLYTDGEVTGAVLSDGTVVDAAPIPKVTQGWNEVTAEMDTYEVVWCGASRRNVWSHTRGELLGDYSRIPDRRVKDVGQSLKVKVATWQRRMLRDEKEVE
jgi:hypothetical protein